MCMEVSVSPRPRAKGVADDKPSVASEEPRPTGHGRQQGGWDEGDYCTTLLAGLWFALCTALYFDYRSMPLWVVLAGLIAYTCLSVGVSAVLPSQYKLKQRSILSHAVVCICHVLATATAAGIGATVVVKLALACGYLTFSLWDSIVRRLYVASMRKYLGLFQEAAVLMLAMTAICKRIDTIHPDLLVGLPAIASVLEALQELMATMSGGVVEPAVGASLWAQCLSTLACKAVPHTLLLLLHVQSLLPCSAPIARPGLCLMWGAVVLALLTAITLLDALAALGPLLLPTAAGASAMAAPAAPHELWYVHGQAYDLRSFLSRHPGGYYALKLGQGRDCTAMFESYHPFTDRHRQVLAKHRVHVSRAVLDLYTAAEAGKEEDEFYATLKTRVAEVLRQHGRDTVASSSRGWYYVGVLVVVYASYLGYLRGSWAALPIFGLSSWLMGAMGHDGAHFSCSHRPWLNQACALGISLICSPLMWYHQHTFGHHSYTNDIERDPDLHHFSFLRLHRHYPYEPRYRWQRHRWYIYLQYGMVAFGETIWIPLKLMTSGTIHGIVTLPHLGLTGLACALAHLLPYLYLILWLPSRQMGGGKAAAFIVLYIFQCGLYFGLFSQINHLNEDSITAAGKPRKHRSWAAEQVETSANFAPHSRLWFVLSNGLNMQIEHHLFPSVNHEHLPLIQPAVEQTCREFGVSYKSYDSFWGIMTETARYYYDLATPDVQDERPCTAAQ